MCGFEGLNKKEGPINNYISIISRGKYKNWTIWLVEKARCIRLYSPRWSLITKQATFAISSSKHFGQFLNEVSSFIRKTSLQVHDIWKDEEF